jgi:hypothetical protein
MGSVRSEIWGSHRKVSRMVTKVKKSESGSVRDLAAAIVANEASERQRVAEQREADLALYRQLIQELASMEERDAELLQAARIVGERCGYSAGDDLRNLDAIRDCERLVTEFGDLDAYQQVLNVEFAGFAEAQRVMREKHTSELRALNLEQKARHQFSLHVARIHDAAKVAAGSISHLTVEGA